MTIWLWEFVTYILTSPCFVVLFLDIFIWKWVIAIQMTIVVSDPGHEMSTDSGLQDKFWVVLKKLFYMLCECQKIFFEIAWSSSLAKWGCLFTGRVQNSTSIWIIIFTKWLLYYLSCRPETWILWHNLICCL